MSAIQDITIPLIPGGYYHIFNRGVSSLPLFYKDRNYQYFLDKYFTSMHGFVDTFAYCLLENHFHLLIKVHPFEKVLQMALEVFENVDLSFYKSHILNQHNDGERDLLNFRNLANLALYPTVDLTNELVNESPSFQELPLSLKLCAWAVSERLRRFLLGYAKAINQQESRTGSLFQKLFRRKLIVGEEDKKLVLAYILHNPIHHECSHTMVDYPWSSHKELFNIKDSKTNNQEIFKWFNGQENLKKYLDNYVDQYHFFHMD